MDGRRAAGSRRARSCGRSTGRFVAATRWRRARRGSLRAVTRPRRTGKTASGVPVCSGPGDDRQSTDVRQRQARQPVIVVGHTRVAGWSPRPMRRLHHGSARPLWARRSTHSSRRRGHRRSSTSSPTRIAASDRRGPPGGVGRRKGGITGVPDASQPVDEGGSARHRARRSLAGHVSDRLIGSIGVGHRRGASISAATAGSADR